MPSNVMSSSLFHDKSISTAEKYRNSMNDVPKAKLEFSEKVYSIEFSPYLWCHDLICVALASKIIVGQIKFKEEDDCQIEEVSYRKVEELRVEHRVHRMCLSPESNIKIAPKTIILAFTNSKNQLIIVAFDHGADIDRISTKVINSHTGYINGIEYDKEGNFLASCSDDLSCRIWSAANSYAPIYKFFLSSPGIAVSWHKDDSAKLLVAEKSGVITLHNVTTRQTVLSLRSQASPLLSMDWSPTNTDYISAICGGNLVLWCINSPSAPLVDRTVHSEGGIKVKFFPLCESKLLTLGSHDNTLKIHQTSPSGIYTTNISSSLKMCTELTCHHNLPYICTASDNFVTIWKLPV
ncbi:nucleoporin Nup37 [Cimex lectularius]|uniref:WD repeat-containing protein 55 homolog n=1 Tax=Cimex lectularius TaxID=79782 RepID=A0A8I6RZ97_CIMLE|nr:nucleoporin Nup37 [Cimex lectularius]